MLGSVAPPPVRNYAPPSAEREKSALVFFA